MTDVEVPAQMIVDGETYENVGVRFRGNTSYMMVPRGSKRPLNLTIDYGKQDQRLCGRTTLNLLNPTDPSFLRTVLYDLITANSVR
jgi:spore coat protein CotH